MIKVEHTKTHVAIPQGKSMHHDIQVTDAKLVLVHCESNHPELEQLCLVNYTDGRDKLLIADGLIINPPKGNEIIHRYLIKSILISLTEKIEVGDKCLMVVKGHHLYNQILTCSKIGESGYYIEESDDFIFFGNMKKILALPEHFSPEQLQMIVVGKLKEDKVLVECEEWFDQDAEVGSDWGHKSIKRKIKLNPHITIYPVEEKLRSYEEAVELLYQIMQDKLTQDITTAFKKKWFEQNVK